jgi:hypothetical protein
MKKINARSPRTRRFARRQVQVREDLDNHGEPSTAAMFFRRPRQRASLRRAG